MVKEDDGFKSIINMEDMTNKGWQVFKQELVFLGVCE